MHGHVDAGGVHGGDPARVDVQEPGDECLAEGLPSVWVVGQTEKAILRPFEAWEAGVIRQGVVPLLSDEVSLEIDLPHAPLLAVMAESSVAVRRSALDEGIGHSGSTTAAVP